MKKIKYNTSYFKNLPEEDYINLLNYDEEALPTDIWQFLYGLTPNFERDHLEILKNNNELDYLYGVQRVKENQLNYDDTLKKRFEDSIKFFDKFPEYKPMINEIVDIYF